MRRKIVVEIDCEDKECMDCENINTWRMGWPACGLWGYSLKYKHKEIGYTYHRLPECIAAEQPTEGE